MEEGRVRVADIAGDLETNALDPDLHPESVFLVIKATSEGGDTAWAARSAGAPLSSEELLGALEGLYKLQAGYDIGKSGHRSPMLLRWEVQDPRDYEAHI